MNKTSRITILIVLIILVASLATTLTYAYWSGTPTQNIGGENVSVIDNKINASYKYLVFEPVGVEGEYCFEYTDLNGWVLKEEYEDDYLEENISAGERTAISTNSSAFTNVNDNITGVRVVGYFGVLGEYEALTIPNSIEWNEKTLNVVEINIKISEYIDSFNLIKSVVIPSNVTKIKGVSFSNANNLEKVYINKKNIADNFIESGCFIGGKTKTYYKLNDSDEYVVFTRGA